MSQLGVPALSSKSALISNVLPFSGLISFLLSVTPVILIPLQFLSLLPSYFIS